MPQRPDAREDKEKGASENQETVPGAPVDPAVDHLHSRSGAYRDLFAGERLAIFLRGDADLPCAPTLKLSGPFVLAASLLAEIGNGTHGRHAHGRHGRHEESHRDLSAGDRSSTFIFELDPKRVISLARRRW